MKRILIYILNKIGLYTKEQYNSSIESSFDAALHGWDKKTWITVNKKIDREGIKFFSLTND